MRVAEGGVIGRLLCLVGLHEWWHRSTWPSIYETARSMFAGDYKELRGVSAVCGRCPAKRYR